MGDEGVSQEDLDSVREAQAQMMPERVWVDRRTVVRDSRGGTRVTYVRLDDPIPGRVGQLRDDLRVGFADRLRGTAAAMLTVPTRYDEDGLPDSLIAENDRVEVLGATYNVVGDLSRGSYSTAFRYLIEEAP